MTSPHINRIGCALPSHGCHAAFLGLAQSLLPDDRTRRAFARLAGRAGIAERWSVMPVDPPPGHAASFFPAGAFPGTDQRMAAYAREAPILARAALDSLGPVDGITHVIAASCTGFRAPGLDQILLRALGAGAGTHRMLVGFMGCQAGIIAMRAAADAVRADPRARVLVMALELGTLHLQERTDVAHLMGFLQFADGAACALVTAEPEGLRLDGFTSTLLPEGEEEMVWQVGMQGFDLHLSPDVPATLKRLLPGAAAALLPGPAPDLWAVHPGGRAILDAAEAALALAPEALAASRAVLSRAGNMSSATILFVLRDMLAQAARGQSLAALAFGPGLSAEALRGTVA
ncbi:putative naringenin-chalcone synthase [Humitalea rosea]|uniref:Putative naringenin-chalcone synthase n=1 Tax=Humitalea rosea TaxID=990373 RepID=A0A2W7IJT1_9PROT|nr:3-oxoacyl-[acyl-carrier-protein] synthase III C-terminal domain-containing protein [Humitalea rosea]PZW47047.1 putative naringenin-chalcone synthase [Humitalea rosea]